MPDRLFQIGGVTVPPLVGRRKTLERLSKSLTKKTPDHIQIVGPRFAGKTVVLNALADVMRSGESPYTAVLLWDLRHQTPDSDGAFLQALKQRTADAICATKKEYAEHLRLPDGKAYSDLCDVFDALASEGAKVLMLWDGLDKPLGDGKLTRNLWDQLRELASKSSLRLVTTSRRPLHELIRSTESQTSDFWGIFDPSPIRLERFDEADIDEAISKLDDVTFAPGARTELVNWTGGFPVILLEHLNAIHAEAAGRSVDAAAVNRIAESLSDSLDGWLSALWTDCPQESKDLFHALLSQSPIEEVKCGQSNLSPLLEKGFATKTGSKCYGGCRFLTRYVAKYLPDLGSLARLFGSEEAFLANIRPLLDRRLSHLHKLDPALRRYIARAIEDIPDHPEVCLGSIRGIVDRALDLVWNAELGPAKLIPPEYFTSWQSNGEKGPEQYWKGNFPDKRGHQVRLLHLLTGTKDSPPKAKTVTRNMYALVNAAQGFADFGQHIDGITVGLGVAFAAVSVCLELAAHLEGELKGS